jgi:hypothetical protein
MLELDKTPLNAAELLRQQEHVQMFLVSVDGEEIALDVIVTERLYRPESIEEFGVRVLKLQKSQVNNRVNMIRLNKEFERRGLPQRITTTNGLAVYKKFLPLDISIVLWAMKETEGKKRGGKKKKVAVGEKEKPGLATLLKSIQPYLPLLDKYDLSEEEMVALADMRCYPDGTLKPELFKHPSMQKVMAQTGLDISAVYRDGETRCVLEAYRDDELLEFAAAVFHDLAVFDYRMEKTAALRAARALVKKHRDKKRAKRESPEDAALRRAAQREAANWQHLESEPAAGEEEEDDDEPYPPPVDIIMHGSMPSEITRGVRRQQLRIRIPVDVEYEVIDKQGQVVGKYRMDVVHALNRPRHIEGQ